jgi:hypothetical protein
MSEIVNSLMPRASSPDANKPSAATPAAPQGGAQVQSVADKFPLLHDLVAGDVPGVYAPKGFKPSPELAAMTNMKMIKTLSLGIYRPKDPDVAAVMFNPAKISIADLQAADKKDELTKILTPITKYAGGPAQGGPAPVGDGPMGGLNGQNAPAAQGGAQLSPEPTQVMPRPTFGAEAQKMAAEMRSKNFAPQAPTAAPMPGAGNILNGLLKRAQ